MDAVEFREYCLVKPRATEGMPFGETVLVFKVAGKMFALLSLDEVPATANLKCDPDLALDLRDRYQQVRPGYHMNKKHWNTIEIEGVPAIELRKMVDHSYDLVVQSLPKSVGAALPSGKRKKPPGTAASTVKRPRAVARRRSAIVKRRARC
ncbi:MAG TPA: MmcQ/YjbR family DNA-binding protein [Chthoniobacterales bacterium]|nr:MmcQ/YjbR family DNA-binding protein [Chthoniobacterales bacterium]